MRSLNGLPRSYTLECKNLFVHFAQERTKVENGFETVTDRAFHFTSRYLRPRFRVNANVK